MSPAFAEPSHVPLLADARLAALRGQALQVGDCVVEIPLAEGPISVPARTAQVLLRQEGWRLANPGDRARVDAADVPDAPVIDMPVPTANEAGRLRVGQVSSPAPAEMAALERVASAGSGAPMTSMAEALADFAAARGATLNETTASGPEAAALPVSAPSPLAGGPVASDEASAAHPALGADTSHAAEFGGGGAVASSFQPLD